MGQKKERKIIAITHEFCPFRGGIAVYVEEVASRAIDRGHDFAVWAPVANGINYNFNFSVRGLPTPWLGTQSWPSRIRLANFLLRNKSDWMDSILYLPDPGPIRTWMYLNNLGFPKPKTIVITLHGSEIASFTAYPHRKLLFRKLLQVAHKIGVVSKYNKKSSHITFQN